MKQKQEDALVIVIGALVVVGALLLGVGIALGFAALQAFIIQLLWNFTMPAIFGLPVIGFWQTWALMILIGLVIRWFRGVKKS
jgi:hypothetical protein